MPAAGQRVALTFDDCRFAEPWAGILDVLAAEGIRAAFFCPGPAALRDPELARRTSADGHTVGAHGWDHRPFPELSRADVRAALERDEGAWHETTGGTLKPWFRPPYGASDAAALEAAASAGFWFPVLWDVDPRDWERPASAVLVERVTRAVAPGSIVVLHVLEETAAALPAIVRGLRRRGVEPTGLAELLLYATADNSAGSVTGRRHSKRSQT